MQQYLSYILDLYAHGIFSIKSLDSILFIHSEFNPKHIWIENEERYKLLMDKMERLSTDELTYYERIELRY